MIFSKRRFSDHLATKCIKRNAVQDDRHFDYIIAYKEPKKFRYAFRGLIEIDERIYGEKFNNLASLVNRRQYNRNTRENLMKIRLSVFAFMRVPYYQRNRFIIKEMLTMCGDMIEFIAQDTITPSLALSVVKSNSCAIKYIPEHMITREMLQKIHEYVYFVDDDAADDLNLEKWKGHICFLPRRLRSMI